MSEISRTHNPKSNNAEPTATVKLVSLCWSWCKNWDDTRRKILCLYFDNNKKRWKILHYDIKVPL